ncbi:MAG: hypothetical protein AAF526_14290 [Pseudomonadota bacterium]
MSGGDRLDHLAPIEGIARSSVLTEVRCLPLRLGRFFTLDRDQPDIVDRGTPNRGGQILEIGYHLSDLAVEIHDLLGRLYL